MTKKLTLIVYLTFLVMFGISCNVITSSRVLNPAFDAMLQNLLDHNVNETHVSAIINDTTSFVFLDAREKNEYNISHIKGAIWVGYNTFKLDNMPDTVSLDDEIIIYCSVGYRSEKITKTLIEAGFKNVYNLYGGIFEWVNQDQPIINSNQSKTDSVHAFNKSWAIWLEKGTKVY